MILKRNVEKANIVFLKVFYSIIHSRTKEFDYFYIEQKYL